MRFNFFLLVLLFDLVNSVLIFYQMNFAHLLFSIQLIHQIGLSPHHKEDNPELPLKSKFRSAILCFCFFNSCEL